MTNTMTETQIRNAARKVARKAKALRAKGQHEAAERLVQEAAANVAGMRQRGEVA